MISENSRIKYIFYLDPSWFLVEKKKSTGFTLIKLLPIKPQYYGDSDDCGINRAVLIHFIIIIEQNKK